MIAEHLYNTIGKIDHLSNSVIHAWHSDFPMFVRYITIHRQTKILGQMVGTMDSLDMYHCLRREKNHICRQFESNFKKK